MIRTCDQRFRKPLLYPLSYEGKSKVRKRRTKNYRAAIRPIPRLPI